MSLYQGRYYKVDRITTDMSGRASTFFYVRGVDDYERGFFDEEAAVKHAEMKEREAAQDLFVQPIYNSHE